MSANPLLVNYLRTAQEFYAAVKKLATQPMPETMQ